MPIKLSMFTIKTMVLEEKNTVLTNSDLHIQRQTPKTDTDTKDAFT